MQLSSLRGKAVVLNVWASWCIPCKDEAPYLEEVWRANRDRDVVVVGIDAKDFRADARRFAKRFALTFPLAYDGPGDAIGHYGVTGFPETFVIDRKGRVVRAFAGAVNGAEERRQLRSAIWDASSCSDPRGPSSAVLGALVDHREGRPRLPGRGGPRGRDRLPGLRDDARPVERSHRL